MVFLLYIIVIMCTMTTCSLIFLDSVPINGYYILLYRMISSSPSVLYSQRKNSGHALCSMNDSLLPGKWAGTRAAIKVQPCDPEFALTGSYQYMFQKVSDKALSE